jgi:hypothetical protein
VVDVTARETRLLQPGRVYVGWRYAQVHDDPGPPPKRPTPPESEKVDQEWLASQRQKENLFNRPLKMVGVATGLGALLFIVAGVTGTLPWAFAVAGLAACAAIAGITGYSMWQSEKALRARMAEENERFQRREDERRRRLEAAHAAHARAYQEWQHRREAFESQHEWYAVTVPQGVARVDVAGGTLSGWSAMVTMMGAARLASGSQVTVLDLSEGAVAKELVELGNDQGERPQVWVLPGDLPQLDLTHGLGPEELADVLSLVVSVSEEQSSTRDLSFDNAILERVLGVFGGRASIPRITAALRALAQVGDPRDDLRSGLITDEELAKITTMFGRGAADRVVIERAWALESQLRKLEKLGSNPTLLPPSRLRVITTDRRAGVLTNRVLGTYVAAALTHVLRASQGAEPWAHTLILCGAEKLRGDVLDRLIDSCEATSTGLVLMYRSIPPHVKERLGRGHAAVGFMRLGNAEDARVAAEQIGAEKLLEVAELTDKLGDKVADAESGSYTSTVGRSVPVVFDGAGTSEDELPDGIGRATAWGQSTSLAADAGKGSREFAVEPQELQQLPPTAMIFTHAEPSGRRILLVDANPGIMTLPTANIQEYEEATGPTRARHAKPDITPPDGSRPAPNLGPPPERLDFRKKKR